MYSRSAYPTPVAVPTAAKGTRTGRLFRRVIVALLIVSGMVTLAYSTLSIYIATQLVYVPPTPIYATPASLGLQFKDVTFPSRVDQVQLRGWFIPGVLSGGRLTAQRTIVVVHGSRTNRADQAAGLLNLSGQFARHGFAVLAFDMRGMGESPPAPLSLGYFEQRDVLGAVDFLRSGPIPYPDLGRPRLIGGWGVSMGAATLLLAASQEPAIRAVVSDSAYADILPILEREVPKGGHLPPLFTPGALLAARALYGMDFYAVRPVDVVARLAPRPVFFIHGTGDTYIPQVNMALLAAAARTAPDASVQTWLVPGAQHAQAFNTHPQEYVARVMAFFTNALGPDTNP
ncbi:MAG TPA: alpha/beta hydrolase [Ktedonobacteraceae bacterium]|nr:alpha/beta hydrolase [Ktedonobacteraceae bacterium]